MPPTRGDGNLYCDNSTIFDELAIYGIALSAGQAKKHYNAAFNK